VEVNSACELNSLPIHADVWYQKAEKHETKAIKYIYFAPSINISFE